MNIHGLMNLGVRKEFSENKELHFQELISGITDTAKDLIITDGHHNPIAFVVLNDGSLFGVNLYNYPDKDTAAHALKVMASFPMTYGLVVVLESWIKKLDIDDPALKEVSSGEKQVSDFNNKEEVLMIISESVENFKEINMISLIRTQDNKIILGSEEKIIDSKLSGRFTNFFDKSNPEMLSANNYLN